jgi:type I restriction enzyme S subunit
MTGQWPSTELGSIAQFRNGLNYTQAAREHGGLPIIGVKDFQSRSFAEFDDLEELDADGVDPGDLTIKKGDILFVRSNGNRQLIGRSLLVREEPSRATTYSGFTIRLRFTDPRCDPRFYAYVLRGPLIRQVLSSQGGGTNISNLNQTILARLMVPVPTPDEQRRIVSILGAYDDLIEVNRRRIALLEEMARRLFEAWFVRFHFPGHAGHKIVDTPDGPLPEGWKAGTAADLIDFDPTTRIGRDGRKPFISMNSLSTNTSLIGELEWREGNSGAKFANGDTLFARITPCLENGKTGLVRGLPGDGLGFGSTEFIVMRGKTAGAAFCYELARLTAFREHARRSMSGASGRQRARTDSLRAYQLGIPPAVLLEKFEAAAWPLLELSGSLGVANERLASARDLLLARLISGDLSVTAAERELEAVA